MKHLQNLQAWNQGLGASLAMDTEFMWQTTYWPKLSIIQAAHNDKAYIFDGINLADKELDLLKQLLDDDSILKLFHAPRDDLLILHRLTGIWPSTFVDTQLAALFCGEQQTVGLDKLCHQLLGVEIDKTHQVSNWLNRPLSNEQLTYAIEDVTYLEELWHKQAELLMQRGYLDWLEEDLEATITKLQRTSDPWLAWRCVSPRSANPRAMAYSQALAAWREIYAQKVDRAIGHILSNESLSLWAAKPSASPANWKARLNRQRLKLSKDEFDDFMTYIEKAENLPEEDCPVWPTRRFTQKEDNKLKKLRKLLKNKATEYNLPMFLIASKKQLSKLILGKPSVVDTGWRYEIFGKEAHEIVV